MEEKKTLKIKKTYLIIFTLAIVFAIMGFIDLKVNAAELEPYINLTYTTQIDYTVSGKDGYTFYNYDGLQLTGRLAESGFDDFAILRIAQLNESGEVYGYKYEIYVVDSYGYSAKLSVGYDASFSSIPEYAYYKSGIQPTNSSMNWKDIYLSDFETVNNMDLRPSDWKSYPTYNRIDVDTNIPMFSDMTYLENYLLTGDKTGQIIDWSEFLKNASVNDDIPCVTNVHFDKIESKESFAKTITDYITFDSNPNYRLAIMLCPSVYSSVRSNDFIGKFDVYQYDKWVFMTTSDIGLKEISCNIGTFSIPTSGVESIVDSNYKRYYESILYGLSENGSVNFVPTMGYQLAYVDLSNNQIGPSTYILPNYYDNLDPDDEVFSFFTLYSDGTKGSEKVMNLKTWKEEEFISLDGVKDVINKVNDKLNDYQIIDSDLGVGEATSWLQSVASFIKGTPSFVGSVMSFLPEPVRYGMFVCLFLGVIASGYAIVKALI